MEAISASVLGLPAGIMGALGLFFGAMLAYASIKFFVRVDERIAKIREALPGANCGSCGYPGCDGYADGIVNDGAPIDKCAPGGADVSGKIAEIMGVSAGLTEPMRAFVRCKGTAVTAPRNSAYVGVQDCRAAATIPGGTPNGCPFGCIGLGTCVRSCTFDALKIVDGLPQVDLTKCTGCGACAGVCPKNVIAVIPAKAGEQVMCNSKWRGPDVRKVCQVGCIGCGLCVKACPSEAITLDCNLAVIDAMKCTGCGTCAEKCPAKVIAPARPKEPAAAN